MRLAIASRSVFLETPIDSARTRSAGGHPNLREDLLDFRHMLEGQAAEWAAERATDADLTRLSQALEH